MDSKRRIRTRHGGGPDNKVRLCYKKFGDWATLKENMCDLPANNSVKKVDEMVEAVLQLFHLLADLSSGSWCFGSSQNRLPPVTNRELFSKSDRGAHSYIGAGIARTLIPSVTPSPSFPLRLHTRPLAGT